RQLQRAVMRAEDLASRGLHRLAVEAAVGGSQPGLRLAAEDHADPAQRDGDAHLTKPSRRRGSRRLPSGSMRSRQSASATMAKPALKPCPSCIEDSARMIGMPRPAAPTMAALTTIDSDSMLFWFSPSRIRGRGEGSSTLHSNCQGEAPKARPASISAGGVWLMPSQVSRI